MKVKFPMFSEENPDPSTNWGDILAINLICLSNDVLKNLIPFQTFFYEEVWTVSFWGLATIFPDWILTEYVKNVVLWLLKVSKVAFFMH